MLERKDKEPTLIVDSIAADGIAECLRGRYAFSAEASAWHEFVGTHWQTVRATLLDEVLTELLFTACGELGFRATYLASVGAILRKGNLIPLPTPLNRRIPFRNGLLDIETGVLQAVTADNADMWCIPHNYRPGSEARVFMEWLDTATGGCEGKKLMVRAFIAAAITGRADLQKFVYLLGPGGTGKSTFMRLLQAILGPLNCITTDLKNLEQNRFETARLYGKRLAIVSDTDKYGGSVNVLKALTGQDPLRNEQKHIQQNGTFIFGGIVLMAGNEVLQSTDYTSGLSRRMMVVKFDRVLTGKEKREFIESGGEDRLQEEIPAVINWALEMDRDRVSAVFMHPPEEIQRSTFDAAADQNPLLGWITATLVPKAGHKAYIGTKVEGRTESGVTYFEGQQIKLYPNYLQWCRQSGRESVSLHRFSRLVLDVLRNTLGIDARKGRDNSANYLQGIAIDEARAADHWGES